MKTIRNDTVSSFPRVCGDVSASISLRTRWSRLSPRKRGCFLSLASSYLLALAFPAYAGMFLRLRTQQARPLCFPRVCGDVSFIVVSSTLRVKLSPRMRGCFFRDCSLCRPLWLSPRMRGCFSRQSANARSLCAFPAYAGMFLFC